MKKQILFVTLLSLWVLPLAHVQPSRAKTFYVRPPGDCPKNGDGTAYECATGRGQTGAWHSLSSVSWGTGRGQVGPGDTLYVCGTHDGQLVVGMSGSEEKPIVIKGDYPGDPGTIRCPATSLDSSWTQFSNTNIYYQTISNADWVGQVFLNDLSHDNAMICSSARGKIGIYRYGDFRAYLTKGGQTNFRGYEEHPGNGTIEADGDTWLAAANEYPKLQVSCKLTKRAGDETYIRKTVHLAADTVYVLSYGGRTGGNGTGKLQTVCQVGGTKYYLQNPQDNGVYGKWSTSASWIGSKKDRIACITTSDTTWNRKWMFFKTHPTCSGKYYLYFQPEVDDKDGNEYIQIDDINVFTVSHLPPNSFTALSAIHGDSGSRSMDVTLYVHMPDSAAPGNNEVLYQHTRQAIDLDNRTYIEIRNLETWGTVSGDLDRRVHGRHCVAVTNCTIHYGGGSMQGPNGKFGDKSSRFTGAVSFIASKDHGYHKATVKNCRIEKSLGIGVYIRRCRSGEVSNNIIKAYGSGNSPWVAAFHGTRANDFLVEGNVCDTTGPTGSKVRGHGAGIWFDGNSENSIVRYNWVKNVTGGYYNCESSDNGQWYYNIGSGGAKYGFHLGGGHEAHGNRIYNNVLCNVGNVVDETGKRPICVGMLLLRQKEGETLVKNNIIQCDSGYYVYVHSDFRGDVTIDHNDYYGLSGNRWNWKGANISSFTNWQKAGGNKNDMNGPGERNPRLVNAEGDNFHLQPDSPCIDAGDNVGLHRDFEGISVPQGDGVDIGGYEYNKAPTKSTSALDSPVK